MAKLKMKDEMMNSILLMPMNFADISHNRSLDDFKGAVDGAIENNWLSSHSKLERYFNKIDDTDKANISALYPACAHCYKDDESNDEPDDEFFLNDYYINNPSKCYLKNLKNKFKTFTWLDMLNWLNFLSKQDFHDNDKSIIALSNISLLLSHDFQDDTLFLSLGNKKDVLKNTIHEDYGHEFGCGVVLNDIKTISKVNKKVTELLNKKQKFYIDNNDFSNKELHKKVIKYIEMIKNKILQVSIQGSRPITCPHCHLFTYSKYKYCQNCGAKLR